MTFTPTPEQIAILTAGNNGQSLCVSALAGAAKTTTITLLANALPPNSSSLAIAFNTRIKTELETRLPKSTQCLTFNGLGHRALGAFLRKKLFLETQKTSLILKSILDEYKLKLPSDEFSSLMSLISSCKTVGYIPHKLPSFPCTFRSLFPTDLLPDLALAEELDLTDKVLHILDRVLTETIAQALKGTIDFSDQIYIPCTTSSISFPTFSRVFVDEAQDLSALNHIQLSRTVAPNAQVFIFGDPHQSIYAFRGAKSNGMQELAKKFSTHSLPLNTSFRCPEAICSEVRKHVPEIVSGSNISGVVTRPQTWSLDDLFLLPSTAVLCRNNAPLFLLASLCIRKGRPVRILGAEIGKNLIKVVKKASPLGTTITGALDTYFKRELASATENKIHKLREQQECLTALTSTMESPTTQSLIALLETLFSPDNTGAPTFSSGHKAKGLEWSHIFFLDPWRIPSQYAETPEELQQEDNLRYVIITRAKASLTYVNVKNCIDVDSTEQAA